MESQGNTSFWLQNEEFLAQNAIDHSTFVLMRILLQKVSEASVTVDKNVVGQIAQGYLLYIGLLKGDSEENLRWMAEKVLNLRLYPSTILDHGGSILAISQFTLAADVKNGNRPDYINAMPAAE